MVAVERFVSSRGYAYPEEFAPEDAGYAIPLADLTNRRASLVLGEPGAGKTTALLRLAKVLPRDTYAVHLLDLRDCYSESSLESAFDRVEESDTGADRVHVLLLDSVDETRVLIRKFVRFLERRLATLIRGNWRIIAACRTAESVRALDELFEGLEAGAIHVLLPLRRADVVTIAESRGVDSENFLLQVAQHRLQSLAATPLALSLMVDIFQADGRFPESRGLIFQRAISLMTAEDAVNGYTPTPREEAFPLRQRAAIERLAAYSTFTDVTSFALFNVGEESAGCQTERLLGTERIEGTHLEVSNQDLQSALRTSLFATRGFNERQFSHRQLTDFLAANHIHRARLSESQLRSILTVADGAAVPPQMADVATWLVSQQPHEYTWLLDADPLTLVRNRITEDLPHLAHDMVERLIQRADDVERSLSWRDELSGLCYPGMTADFDRYLHGQESTQWVALRILRDSYTPGLESTLTALLQDSSTGMRIREEVATVVRTHRVGEVLGAIDWRHADFFKDDDHQELRGAVLSALWPNFITPEELVDALVQPREHFLGAYHVFVSQLSKSPTLHLARVVLESWAFSRERQRTAVDWDESDDEFSPLTGLVDAAVARALAEPTLPRRTLAALAQVVAQRLSRGRGKLPFAKSEVAAESLHELISMVVQLEGDGYPLWFAVLSARGSDDEPLVSRSDLNWLAAQALGAPTNEFDPWLNLIDRLLDPTSDEDMTWAWRQQDSPLWAVISRHFEATNLDSEAASQARTIWEMNHRITRKPNAGGMSPEEYVNTIRRIMADVERQPATFWFLMRWLDVDLTSRRYAHNSGPDLLAADNVALLDDRDRSMILRLAKRYVQVLNTPERPFPLRLQRNKLYYGLDAAYRALHTLYLHRPDELSDVAEGEWNVANLALLEAYLGSAADEASTVRRELLATSRSVSATNLSHAIDAFFGRVARGTSLGGAIGDLAGLVEPTNLKTLRRAIHAGVGKRAPLIDLYLRTDPDGASQWISALAFESPDELEIASALGGLITFSPELGYDLLDSFCTIRPQLARPVLLQIAQHERFASERIREVDPTRRIAVYIHLATLFPSEEESFPSGVHAVTPREDLARWRSELLHSVAAGGTREGLVALLSARERISGPELDYALVAAREAFRMNGWSPLSVAEFSAVAENARARLARSVDDVMQVVLDALDELQEWLRGETPQAFALWNTGPSFRNPKDENQLSDWYCHSLRLVLASGLIVNREVEVANPTGRGVGSRQDIRIEVRDPDTGEHFAVVVEVKGIWNREVLTNLTTQLAGDYLASGGLTHGIYLVVDFDSSQMTHQRNIRQADRNRRGLQRHLESQAAALPAGIIVRPVVHDASLPARG